jgi:hypothetical protein
VDNGAGDENRFAKRCDAVYQSSTQDWRDVMSTIKVPMLVVGAKEASLIQRGWSGLRSKFLVQVWKSSRRVMEEATLCFGKMPRLLTRHWKNSSRAEIGRGKTGQATF